MNGPSDYIDDEYTPVSSIADLQRLLVEKKLLTPMREKLLRELEERNRPPTHCEISHEGDIVSAAMLRWRSASGANAYATLSRSDQIWFSHAYEGDTTEALAVNEWQVPLAVDKFFKEIVPEAESFAQRYLAIKQEVKEKGITVKSGEFPRRFRTDDAEFELRRDGKLNMTLTIRTQPWADGKDVGAYSKGLIHLRGECTEKAALQYLQQRQGLLNTK